MSTLPDNSTAGIDGSGSTPTSGADSPTLPCVALSSHEVLRGQKSVSISHNGALYRLQTTRQGKLILTK